MQLRWRILLILSAVLLILFVIHTPSTRSRLLPFIPVATPETFQSANVDIIPENLSGRFNWADIPYRYPVKSTRSLPKPVLGSIPKIQAAFGEETSAQKQERLSRLDAVKGNFTHAWNGYKAHAWLKDEVAPLSHNVRDHSGGWAATLIDALGM